MLPEQDLRRVLPVLPRIALQGPWARAVGYHHLQGPPPGAPRGSSPQPLWPGGAPLRGARFTPKGGFESIYLASDGITALLEVVAVIQHPHAGPVTLATYPWTVFAVNGSLSEILDLCDPNVQHALGTSLQELTGDWAYLQEEHLQGRGALPSTQLLGRAAHDSGVIVGLRHPSAKNVGKGVGIVVFADRLVTGGGSYLEVFDPQGNLRDRRP